MKYLIAFFITILHTLPCKAQDNQKPYAGIWELVKEDSTSTFNLELKQLNLSVTGTHCISTLNGNKSDCVGIIDEDEISIKGSITNSVLKVTFKGSFADGEGQAEIRFISADKIEWKVTKKIAGENYFPQQATLVKRP